MNYSRIILQSENGMCIENYQPQKTSVDFSLLFVHGNFCGSWCFHSLLAYFASAGFPSYALNFKGHWLSHNHAELGRCTLDDYRADLLTGISLIESPVVLIGHSMGGVICQKIAEQENIRGLILLDSAPNKTITETYFQPQPEVNRLLQELIVFQPDGTCALKKESQGIRNLFFEAGQVSDETVAQTVAFLGRESTQVLKEHAFLSVDANKVSCPVSVLGRKGHGNQKSPDLWNALADYFNAQNRHIQQDMGHGMFLQNNWQEYAQLIKNWLVS